jgi:hypothetical protein
MILTPEQLADLTGRKRTKGQIGWLTDHGYRFDLNAIGRPVVLVKEVEGKLLSPECKTRTRKPAEPNFAAVNAN